MMMRAIVLVCALVNMAMAMQSFSLDGLKYVKGEPISIDAHVKGGRGVLLLERWATWCPPCVHSIPHLTEIANKYKASGLIVLGVTDEAPDAAKAFADRMGPKMDYVVASDTEGVTDRYMDEFNVNGIPSAFLINSTGEIVWNGHPMEPALEEEIKKALAAKVPAVPRVRGLNRLEMMLLKPNQLKAVLCEGHIDYFGCVEKGELVDLIEHNELNKE